MKVAFRVDASCATGLGHLRRSLALAHALAAHGASVRFVTRELDVDSRQMVENEGFRAVALPASSDSSVDKSNAEDAAPTGVDETTDALETVAAMRSVGADTVIVDGYAFGAEWHRTVREELSCRIVAIDDLANRPLAPDLLIDHNFSDDHRAKYRDRLATEVPILGGPRFALLVPAYEQARRYDFSPKVASVGIFMGGTDAENHSATVLAALDDSGYAGPAEIVTTGANPNLAELRQTASKRPKTQLSQDLPDLADFFARHDLQIGAGGGATWERCCIGAPALLATVAENQNAVVPMLARMGAVAQIDSIDRAAIARSLSDLLPDSARRRKLGDASRKLVDGLGARRVAARLLADTLVVRPAASSDVERMYRWRNGPAVRAASKTRAPIVWQDHLAWLERTLADPERTLLIGGIGAVPVGVIRFDRVANDTAEVSLYIDPALLGLGLGRRMLLAGERAAASGLDIVAEVLEENAASAQLFKSAGYRRLDATHWIKPAGSRA